MNNQTKRIRFLVHEINDLSEQIAYYLAKTEEIRSKIKPMESDLFSTIANQGLGDELLYVEGFAVETCLDDGSVAIHPMKNLEFQTQEEE